MSKTAWFDPDNRNHEAQGHACATCGAAPGAPCVSTVPALGHGVTGAPLRGLHASRLGYVAPAPIAVAATTEPRTRTRTHRTRRAA